MVGVGEILPGMQRFDSKISFVNGDPAEEELMMNGGTGGNVKEDKFVNSKKNNGMNDSGVLGSVGEQGVCRICLSEEEEDNPLIVPCSCKGSMG
jgi:hypothetical protein